ncbi:Rho-binding antiterminator [Shewanella algae]|uniref:Rho-binding antiterminator n=1 Tax=Shewanella algae TaxID=38313 RepID=UPI003AAC2D1F
MKPYQAIDCGRYDYLELACIRGYPLKIELLQGEILHGKALITETRPDKSEWLLVQTATSNRAIQMDQLLAITPEQEGAEFGRVLIASAGCEI